MLDIPTNPFEVIDPKNRWKPSSSMMQHKTGKSRMIATPPLVERIREEISKWRQSNYNGISKTSKALLNYWFSGNYYNDDKNQNAQFYRFCQREAIETIIYLYEHKKVRSKTDLLHYDKSNILKESMFEEDWLRLVIKMATGTGKTKVISLAIVWSYFHKTYEEDSDLSRNFLILAPNIIVLDRLKIDFEHLNIFNWDPAIPDNGFENKNWKSDFNLDVHIQSNAKIKKKNGNIFLTNIDRIYPLRSNQKPKFDDDDKKDYFLGKAAIKEITSDKVDLNKTIDQLDELVIMNDEAHHIHSSKLTWYESIERIHNAMLQKNKKLSLQLDTTATPKDSNGSIFPQTICDYPLVEAIHQNIVKRPKCPPRDIKLPEEKDIDFAKQYKSFINLGYKHWKKTYEDNKKINKKAILFIMTDQTKSCEQVADYLHSTFPEFKPKDSVLVIHTNDHGDFIEDKTAKSKKELDKLRKLATEIDKTSNSYIAVISVMMLKEGWDVRNVTTIVGLRAYDSKILPEQTLGRGLRRMNLDLKEEPLGVIGTQKFMDFVNQLKIEGVVVEEAPEDGGLEATLPLIIEIDKEKDIKALDMQLPLLTHRYERNFEDLNQINIDSLSSLKIKIKKFENNQMQQIQFRDIITHNVDYVISFENDYVPVVQGIVGYFTNLILKHPSVRLFSGFDILYPKLKEFIKKKLFEKEVDIEDINILKNLSRPDVSQKLVELFCNTVNKHIIKDKGNISIEKTINICDCQTFILSRNDFFTGPKNFPFNYMATEEPNKLELEFAMFLSKCDDILSFTKNYKKIGFKIDYINEKNHPSTYTPDFIVKKNENETYIIETKGGHLHHNPDTILKKKRLKQWCADINKIQKQTKYKDLYILEKKLYYSLKEGMRSFDELSLRFKDD